MGKASSPARRRGSSAGKASRSTPEKRDRKSADPTSSETLPKWDDDKPLSPKDAATKHAYGELLERYADQPPTLRHRLIKSELTGRALDLRMSDVVPKDGLKFQVSGELYDEIQDRLSKIPEYSSLDFMRTLLYCDKLPVSTRFDVAKEMLPYEHPRNPVAQPKAGEHRAALVLPGIMSVDDWERESKLHRERIKKLEENL